MTSLASPTSLTSFRRAAAVTTAFATAALTFLLAPAGQAAEGAAPALPLGDADLAETRSTETLAPGVTLTRIVRGTEPAPADQQPAHHRRHRPGRADRARDDRRPHDHERGHDDGRDRRRRAGARHA